MTDKFYGFVPKRTLSQRISGALSVTPNLKTVTNPGGAAEGTLVRIIGDTAASSIKRDIPAYLKAFGELPWLRRAVTTLANQLSSNDWDILEVIETTDPQGETDVEMGHPKKITPLQEFLNDPNPDLSFQQLEFLTHVYLDLVGEAYWWMVPIAGDLKAYPVPPDKVTQTPSLEEPWYHIAGPKGEFRIDPEEIISFIQPDPADPYGRGTGLAQSLSHDLDTDDAASRFVLTYFQNNARPPLLIYGEGLSAERTKQLEDDWNQQHQGFWNAGKARFLSRKVEIKELSQKFEGTEVVALRQHQRDTIASVIGVPPEIMGILTASNRATIDAADLFFSRYSLTPRLNFVQEIYNKYLLPRFDDSGTIVMKFVNPVQKDKEMILKAARFMPSALMVDEWRNLMEFDPLDDGDGQCFIVPINMQVLKKLTSAKPAVPGAPVAPGAGKPSPAAQSVGEVPNTPPPAQIGTPPPAQAGKDAYGEIATPFGTLKGRKVARLSDLAVTQKTRKVAKVSDITLLRKHKNGNTREIEDEFVEKALDAIRTRRGSGNDTDE